METYTLLRQLADSWALLAMFTFFVGIVIWAFRPPTFRSATTTSQPRPSATTLRNKEPGT
jgi:hypothetical protein